MSVADLATALRTARVTRRLTQSQLGRLLDPPIGHTLISRYESGLVPPPKTLIQLAHLLGLTITLAPAPASPPEHTEAAVAS